MVWKERKVHITNCYFGMTNLKGIYRKNKHHVQYPDIPSAIKPILHRSDIPVPESEGNMGYRFDSKHSDMTVVAREDAYKSEEDDTKIFIITGFWTIVFIFVVISTTFWPICPPTFFRYLSNSRTFTELRTTSFIESTEVAYSDSVSHNRVQVLSIHVLLLACNQD